MSSNNSRAHCVLVTGASTGIGFESAKFLAEKGFIVWAGVRKKSDFDHIQSLGMKNFLPVILDVTDTSSIERAFTEITQQFKKHSKGFFSLINNAGIVVAGPLEYLRKEDLKSQFEVNVFGLHDVTRTFLPLIKQSGGRIIHVGSISGKVAFPFVGPYCASKFAVEALTDSLRRELRPYKIHVAVIEPGRIKTPIWTKSEAANTELSKELPPEMEKDYGKVLARLKEMTHLAADKGAEPSLVAESIHHALTSSRPRARYRVGLDSKIEYLIGQFMPDRFMDFLASRMLKW